MACRYPGIPAPGNTTDSLWRSVLALKQGYETLVGVPKSSPCAIASQADLEALRLQFEKGFGDVTVAISVPADHSTLTNLTVGNPHTQYVLAPGDHSTLSNLTTGDPHPQYLLSAGDAMTGTLTTLLVNPTADDASDLGTTSLRYRNIFATKIVAVIGNGTISSTLNAHMLGRCTQSGAGVSTFTGSALHPFSSSFYGGVARCTGSTATYTGSAANSFGWAAALSGGLGPAAVDVAGVAVFVHGQALDDGTLGTDLFSDACFVSGQVGGGGLGATATLTAAGFATFAQGYCVGDTIAGLINAGLGAAGAGSFAQGAVVDGGTLGAGGAGGFAQGYVNWGGTISSNASGTFAQGYVDGGGVTTGIIEALGNGSLARGIVAGSGSIRTTGAGAFANGSAATARRLLASGDGSGVFGVASTADIDATATNAFQFGQGVNALANSLKVGTAGIRLIGVAGTPGAPALGDQWIGGTGNAFVVIRSNGKNVQQNVGQTYATGTFTTDRTVSNTAGITATEVGDVLSTLIADLQAAGVLN